jgi:hypothetical protein
VVELTEAHVQKKQKAYQTHRNVYAHPSTARAVRKQLEAEGLAVPDFDGKTDEQAAVLMEEWYMDWISRKVGTANGLKYGEIYYRTDEFGHLPGLAQYIQTNALKQ